MQTVQISTLIPSPFQPEGREASPELVESLRVGGFNPAHPVTVGQLPTGEQYLADGHRRALAAWELGIYEIPAIVRAIGTIDDLAVLALRADAENETTCRFSLADKIGIVGKMRMEGESLRDIAARVGFSLQTVANYALISATPRALDMVSAGMSLNATLAYCKAPERIREELAKEIFALSPASVTESAVDALVMRLTSPPPKAKPALKQAEIAGGENPAASDLRGGDVEREEQKEKTAPAAPLNKRHVWSLDRADLIAAYTAHSGGDGADFAVFFAENYPTNLRD